MLIRQKSNDDALDQKWYDDNYAPHRRGGGHIVIGADPVGVGVSVAVGVSVTLSCLHDISLTGGWILTKFARI